MLKKLIITVATLSALSSAPVFAQEAATSGEQRVCSAYCNPEVSNPCGKGCVSKTKSCRKSWTTACSGENPNKGGKSYAPNEVKHVSEAPAN